MNQLTVYPQPEGARECRDFKVQVRQADEEWKELFSYEAKVDMHQVRSASMAYFDMSGTVEVRIECLNTIPKQVVIRPLSQAIPFTVEAGCIQFTLNQPCKLSIEVNGDRFGNLHLFANPLEVSPPQPHDAGVHLIQPAIHRSEDIYQMTGTPDGGDGQHPHILYFAPGMHYIEETLIRIPSNVTVYVAGGAVIMGSLVCDKVENVTIRGRGIIDLSEFHRYSAFRGIRILFSANVSVEGLIVLDPPHYSIYIGQSKDVHISNFKAFSTRGWCDGIDMMASSDIEIQDVFLRTSDDCIAVYGSRWKYCGDTRRVTVRNSILWADVAHPLMMGTHGNHHCNGDVIEDILFENIDILEHHELQENYWGAMAINAGDKNIIRHVTYENIRVEEFERGQLVDIRVIKNQDYNPEPGHTIENILFRNITYFGRNTHPNRIYGYDDYRTVKNVVFENLRIHDELVCKPEQGNFMINPFTQNITFTISNQSME